MRIALPLVALAVCAVAPAPRAASPTGSSADTWREVRSPNFTVISDADEDLARQLAWQYEQIRAAIRTGWPWAEDDPDRPFVILGVRDESSMRAFAPEYWERGSNIRPGSVASHGWDKHYLLVRTDLRGDARQGRHAYWGYTSTVLSDSFRGRLPLWFTYGLSNVLSNTIVTDDEVQFGRAIPENIGEIQRGRLSLAEVLEATRESRTYTGEIERRRFSAQSWAIMHFLVFGEFNGESNAGRLNEISRLVQSGATSTAAVEQVFGSLQVLDEAYRRYLERGSFRYSVMPVDARFDRRSFDVREIAEAEMLAYRAAYLVTSRRFDDARAAIDASKALAPDLAAAATSEALLLERQNDLDGARAAFARAVELGASDFYTHYRLAGLTRRQGMTPEVLGEVRTLLTRAVEINQGHAGAYSQLGSVLLQLGETEEALVALRRSSTLDPQVAGTRLTLANALLRLGQRDAALREAQAALALAPGDQMRTAAQNLITRIGGGAGPVV